MDEGSVANGEFIGTWKWVIGKVSNGRRRMLTQTYSYDITITIMQALVAPMLISYRAVICCPELGRFGKYRPRIFGKRVDRREAIGEGEKY
jgi:hypothetical protein